MLSSIDLPPVNRQILSAHNLIQIVLGLDIIFYFATLSFILHKNFFQLFFYCSSYIIIQNI